MQHNYLDNSIKPNIPIFETTFTYPNGNIKPIEIAEVLDENGKVIKWKLLQDEVIKKNDGRALFNVGELLLDYINKTEKIKHEYITGNRYEEGLDQILPEAIDERAVIIDILKNFRNDPHSIVDLFVGFRDIHTKYNCKVEIEPLWVGNLCDIDSLRLGNKYKIYGNLEFSFVCFDFYHAVNNEQISFQTCKYCNFLFVKNQKNQQYCKICSEAKIPEKLRKRSNPTYVLKRKIYNRLYQRSIAGNNQKEYYPNLKDHFDFSEISKQKHNELNYNEYFEWLKKIDHITSSK